jgi:hypothetical protein
LPVSEQKEGRKWWIEDRDLESTLDYVREGSLTWSRWLRSFNGVEEAAWFAVDDWKPFLRMLRSLALQAVRKIFRLRKPQKPALLQAEPISVDAAAEDIPLPRPHIAIGA